MIMKFLKVYRIVFLLFIFWKRSIASDSDTLKSLFVVSRHGARAPLSLYDNSNQAAWPNGLGKLTERGKWQMRRIGDFLRKNYSDFLTGSVDEVEFRSARLGRLIESAQLIWEGFTSNEDSCHRTAVPIRVDQVNLLHNLQIWTSDLWIKFNEFVVQLEPKTNSIFTPNQTLPVYVDCPANLASLEEDARSENALYRQIKVQVSTLF